VSPLEPEIQSSKYLDQQAFRATRYFPALDGLRCFSIAAVIWHHSTPRQLEGVAGRGHLGVRLFFCISGLLITTLLLREKRVFGTIGLARFWVRRSLRIFPLYYSVLALFVLFALSLPDASAQRSHFLANLPFYLTHTSNWFVDYRVTHSVLFAFAWSLSTEEQFYLFLPLLVRAVRRLSTLAVVVMLLILTDQMAERQLLTFVLPRHSMMETIVTSFMASIGFGALLAIALEDKRVYSRLAPFLGHTLSAPISLAVMLYWLVWPPKAFVLFELAMALFVTACAMTGKRGLARWLSSEPLCHVGRVSYGMYLFHVPVIGALRLAFPAVAQNAGVLFLAAMAVTTFLATLSHRYFEAWFLGLRPDSRRKSAESIGQPLISGTVRGT
jgi:peptidoglycan/LPS O-acetylase OafA/YrhL